MRRSRCRPLKVLIVDDEPALRQLVAMMVRRHWRGSRCFTAADGVEAAEKAIDLRPDVVLTDIRMPGRDGLELCRFLSAEAALAQTRIVAMTAFHGSRTERAVSDSGAHAYLAKPFTAEELRSVLPAGRAAEPERPAPRRKG